MTVIIFQGGDQRLDSAWFAELAEGFDDGATVIGARIIQSGH